jgi:Na+/glutamate symporter
MAEKVDLLLGLFAGFIIGSLVGIWLTRVGFLKAETTQPQPQQKQYGVQYQYDEQGRLKQVLPVPIPG